MRREYNKLPKSIISPFTGDTLVLQDEIEINDNGSSRLCIADYDGEESFYCDDLVSVYLNNKTREHFYV